MKKDSQSDKNQQYIDALITGNSENLIEEIEKMSRSKKDTLENNLLLLLVYTLNIYIKYLSILTFCFILFWNTKNDSKSFCKKLQS